MSIIIDMHGSMHPALPDGMEKTYRKLYKIASTNYELKELSCFFPLAGNRYCDPIQISEEGLTLLFFSRRRRKRQRKNEIIAA